MGVTSGCTCACAARAASFVLRVRYTCTLSCGTVCQTLCFCDRGDCEVTLFCSALCLTRAAPDLHSDTSGWPVGEVVVQQETAVAAHAHRRGLGALCVSCCTVTLEAP